MSTQSSHKDKPILSFDHVSYAYEQDSEVIVHDLSLSLFPQTFTGIVGPSGAGKSTLLRLSVGLEKPTSGSITNNARTRMIFQDAALLPWRTVRENVLLGFTGLTLGKHEKEKRLHEELATLGLTDYKNVYPRDLSGGQRQRVGIARALVSDPEMLLLDEPFSALDVETTSRLSEELLEIFAKRSITMLMVSHNIEDTVALADEILVFAQGVILHKVPVMFPRPRNLGDPEVERLIKEVKKFIPRA